MVKEWLSYLSHKIPSAPCQMLDGGFYQLNDPARLRDNAAFVIANRGET